MLSVRIVNVLADLILDKEQPSTTKSFIGITVAICGNVIISLALNCQKLAHRRLETQQRSAEDIECKGESTNKSQPGAITSSGETSFNALILEAEPLLARPNESNYKATANQHKPQHPSPLSVQTKSTALPPSLSQRSSTGSSRDIQTKASNPNSPSERILQPVGVAKVIIAETASESPARSHSPDSVPNSQGEDVDEDETQPGTDYLRSRLWWFGFFLMNVGEIGNFLSYGFAPASVVAPLGAFALIANCFFAPLILHERFNKSDLLGMVLAIFGAATIVISTKQSSPHLNPSQLLDALCKRVFIIYSIVLIILIVLLSFASGRRMGKRFVLVDVGLCALFGGFTVLSTKALSTLLSAIWLQIFKEWITYPLLVVLIGTGVLQIKYLNRALMKFDAKQVIPTQFVLFNLSAIVGSAILYGDFERVAFHQFVSFLYGCGATFAGVYLLSSSNTTSEDEQETESPSNREDDNEAILGRLPDIPEELSTDHVVMRSPMKPIAGPIRIIKRKQSTPGIGLSPAQYLLLVAPSTPRAARSRSLERDPTRRNNSVQSRPQSMERRHSDAQQ